MCKSQSVEQRQDKQGFRNQVISVFQVLFYSDAVPLHLQSGPISAASALLRNVLFYNSGCHQSQRAQLGPEAAWERGAALVGVG